MKVSAWTTVIVLAFLIAVGGRPSQAQSVSGLYQTTGYSSHHSPQAQFDKRFSSGLMFMTAYTLSKLIDTGGDAQVVNRNLEKALSVDDQTHTVVTSSIYELPFGVGRHFPSRNRVVANLLGNWRLSASLRYTSGSPIPPIRVEGAPLRTQSDHFNPRIDRWLNPAAFIDPAPFTFGTLGRTLPNLRGRWFANENVGLEVWLRERHTIELRATLLNALNRVVFNNPGATVGAANFGMFSSQKNLPREMELQGRYTF